MFLSSEALTLLFNEYRSELYYFVKQRFAIEDLAEDFVQEAFHKLAASANNVNDQMDVENPRAYLYKTVKNIVLNNIRKEGHHRDYLQTLDSAEELTGCLMQQAVASEDLMRVLKSLDGLSEKDQRTFMLNRMQGKSYKKISQELKISVSTVEKRMIKTLKCLRESIED